MNAASVVLEAGCRLALPGWQLHRQHPPELAIQLEKQELTACTLWEAFPAWEDSASLAFHCPAWKLRGEGGRKKKKRKRPGQASEK